MRLILPHECHRIVLVYSSGGEVFELDKLSALTTFDRLFDIWTILLVK